MAGDGYVRCVVHAIHETVGGRASVNKEDVWEDLGTDRGLVRWIAACDREGDDVKLALGLTASLGRGRVDNRCAILPVKALMRETVPSAQATARIWPVVSNRQRQLRILGSAIFDHWSWT